MRLKASVVSIKFESSELIVNAFGTLELSKENTAVGSNGIIRPVFNNFTVISSEDEQTWPMSPY